MVNVMYKNSLSYISCKYICTTRNLMMNALLFDYVLQDAELSPVRLDCDPEQLLATGGTCSVFRCALDKREAVVKRIKNVLDVPHGAASVNVKSVIDAEVALHVRVTESRIPYAPAFYGVVRVRDGSIEVRGRLVERWTYYLFMEYVPGETLREFLHHRRGAVDTQLAAALLHSLKHTCDAFTQQGITLDDRNNLANMIVRVGTEQQPAYSIIFIDFQHNRWHHRTPRDMFSRPAWLICVAAAYTQHVHSECSEHTHTPITTKGGAVLQSARRIYKLWNQRRHII